MNIVKSIILSLIVTTPLVHAADHGKALTAHRAAQTNDVAALRALVEQNPDVLFEQEQGRFGHTPLICAIKKGHVDVVHFILGLEEGKKAVNTRSRSGLAPLAYVRKKLDKPMTKKSIAIAQQLIEHGADENESSLTRLTHGDANAQGALLRAYCQRQRLENRRLQQLLSCAEEMLAQERERYQYAAGAFCEQEQGRTTLHRANRILGKQLLESQRQLTAANREINAYQATKHSLEQEKSELEQQLSESQDSLKRTEADLAAAELKSDDENAALRAALETERRVTSTLEVVLPEVVDGWEFVLDGSPAEE